MCGKGNSDYKYICISATQGGSDGTLTLIGTFVTLFGLNILWFKGLITSSNMLPGRYYLLQVPILCTKTVTEEVVKNGDEMARSGMYQRPSHQFTRTHNQLQR